VLEAARLGNLPAAVINVEIEPVITAGFILARLLYGRDVPLLDHLHPDPLETIRTGDWIQVNGVTGVAEIEAD
jgi:predicted aconitase with swiveling domain